ncbi:CC0125/CC1285 family lipoprotein [Allohahella marinimesophila]|uniref:Uncharacterized protein n=1 Tax=Allohahella marinimesophila TaxID=1054972 RepID=A0ABP7PFX9_9GAMM
MNRISLLQTQKWFLVLKALVLGAAVAMMSACSALDEVNELPVYQPLEGQDPTGYFSARTGKDLFEVGFQSDRRLSFEQVEAYALERAGELAVAKGASNLDVLARECGELEVQRDMPAMESSLSQLQPTAGTMMPQHTMVIMLRSCRLAVRLLGADE